MIKRVKYIENLDKRDWNSIEKDKDFEKQYPQKKKIGFKEGKWQGLLLSNEYKGMDCVKTDQIFGQKIMLSK